MISFTNVTSTYLSPLQDLIRIHIPHFTVSANDKHFQTISNVVTKLLLFSDATHKARLDKLETLLFTYDFTDLCQAADVIVNLQGRIRAALETEQMVENDPRHLLGEEDTKLGRLRLRAHIITLTEELNYLFDAIKLAQDRTDERMDQKSALLVHASSSEMSWRMLGEDKGLLAKLVVQQSNFYWLSRQDSAMVNDLSIGNLQAFDGSTEAIWTEILSKHDEPANHPLHRVSFLLPYLRPNKLICSSVTCSYWPIGSSFRQSVGFQFMKLSKYPYIHSSSRLTRRWDVESWNTFGPIDATDRKASRTNLHPPMSRTTRRTCPVFEVPYVHPLIPLAHCIIFIQTPPLATLDWHPQVYGSSDRPVHSPIFAAHAMNTTALIYYPPKAGPVGSPKCLTRRDPLLLRERRILGWKNREVMQRS